MKKILLLVAVLSLFFLGFLYFRSNYLRTSLPIDTTGKPIPTSEASKKQSAVPYKVEIFVENLIVPWSLLFTSETRMLVTERPGKIREVLNGKLTEKPLIVFNEVSSIQEEGLMGIEKDLDYQHNHFLYAVISYPHNNGYTDKVVRLIDLETSIQTDKILLDNIPAAQVHAGSRVKFGPDGKLYVTTGDATQKEKAQDPNFLGGKILRINADGTIPSDNPYPNSYVYSSGHRNPQGISWVSSKGIMYETEHGPSTFDGPPGGDEINRIIPGGNYGWPITHHELKKEGLISPLAVYTPAVAPASVLIYDGKLFPQFTNNLFFGGLVGTGLYRVVFDDQNPDLIISQEKVSDINVGRVRDVIEGPDGYIYFSTSNRDGRGKPSSGDDKIYRLQPS